MAKERSEAPPTKGTRAWPWIMLAFIGPPITAAAVPLALHYWHAPNWLYWALIEGCLALTVWLWWGGRAGPSLRRKWKTNARANALLRLSEEEVHPELAQGRQRMRELRRAVVARILICALAVGIVWGTWYALRNALDTYQTRGSLGPADAVEIIAALGGGSAITAAVSVFVVRLMRGYGTMWKDSGAGAESRGKGAEARGKGEAERIRANAEAAKIRAEGEAILIKANAEADVMRSQARAAERLADAEYLRAERGVELPPAPDAPPAIGPAPSANGTPGAPALPAPPGEPDLT